MARTLPSFGSDRASRKHTKGCGKVKFSRHQIPRIVSCLSLFFTGTLFQTTFASTRPSQGRSTRSMKDSTSRSIRVYMPWFQEANSPDEDQDDSGATLSESETHEAPPTPTDEVLHGVHRNNLSQMEIVKRGIQEARDQDQTVKHPIKEILKDAMLQKDAELEDLEPHQGFVSIHSYQGVPAAEAQEFLQKEKAMYQSSPIFHESNARAPIKMRGALRRLEHMKCKPQLERIYEILKQSKGKSTPETTKRLEKMLEGLQSVGYYCCQNILEKAYISEYLTKKASIAEEAAKIEENLSNVAKFDEKLRKIFAKLRGSDARITKKIQKSITRIKKFVSRHNLLVDIDALIQSQISLSQRSADEKDYET